MIPLAAFSILLTSLSYGFIRTPFVYSKLDISSSALATVAIYILTLVFFFASCSRNGERVFALTSSFIGAALTPVAMFLYDASQGNILTYSHMLLSSERVVNTGLVKSPNINAIIGGIGLMSCIWLISERRRLIFFPILLPSLFYVLISQSQGIRVALIVSIFFALLSESASQRIAKAILIVWIISCPLQIFTFSLIGGTWLGELFTRDGVENLGVGTGRSLIWLSALNEIASHPENIALGFGFLSAPTTSAFSAMAAAIGYRDSSDLLNHVHSLHNAALQYAFDFGVVTLLVVSYLLLLSIRKTRGSNAKLTPLIVFTLISGLNEAMATPYNFSSFIFILNISAFLNLGNTKFDTR